MEGTAEGVKPGMTADLRVHLEKKEHVLSLPIEAVTRDKESGKAFVMKVLSLEKGKAKTDKVEVSTGARNDRAVEIVSGLQAGDRILIRPASSAENEYKM